MQFVVFTRATTMQRTAIHVDLIGRVDEERGLLGAVRYGCRIYCRRGRANWKVVESYLDIIEQIRRATQPPQLAASVGTPGEHKEERVCVDTESPIGGETGPVIG